MKKVFAFILTVTLLMTISLTMMIPASAADLAKAETQATALKQLGLFKGVSDTNFDLNRAPTRTEALVMLIRVLGKEPEALNGNFTHPFTDVESWADKYVGYAYQNGLTKGVSATEFGAGNANSDMYLTFVLRALNYDDSAGDFAWDAPDTFAASVGILPDGVDTANFLRADVSLVSWAALEAKLKGSSQTLSGKLIAAGVFTAEQYSAASQTAGATTSITPSSAYELIDGVAQVKSMAELKGAMADTAVSEIDLTQAFEISEDITITKPLLIVEMEISNSAILTVKSNVTLGGAVFENKGDIVVSGGGFFGVYQTEFKNQGQFTIGTGSELEMDRGGQFRNFRKLNNTGIITVTGNGGSLYNDKTGTIENNGVINCSGYYDNLGTYTGSGTEPTGI